MCYYNNLSRQSDIVTKIKQNCQNQQEASKNASLIPCEQRAEIFSLLHSVCEYMCDRVVVHSAYLLYCKGFLLFSICLHVT